MSVDKECLLGEVLNILAPHQKDLFFQASLVHQQCQTVIVNFMQLCLTPTFHPVSIHSFHSVIIQA